MANDPRKLIDITEYRNLLNDKDDVQKVIDAVAAQTADQLAANLAITATALLKPVTVGSASVGNAAFNKHLGGYLKANFTTIVTGVMAYVDGLIASNKAEAEEEAGLLGINSTPITPVAPSVTSSAAADATIGAAFTYTITADNISGPGITSCNYSAANLPAWLALGDGGVLSGTVPDDATDGDSFTMQVTVTTNIGSDTKDVTVTYIADEGEGE